MELDLGKAFVDGSKLFWLATQREDKELAHVSDLSGMCDRLAHARRSGKNMAIPDHQSITAMSLGLHLEGYILDRIEAGLPNEWAMERDLVVVIKRDPSTGRLVGFHQTRAQFDKFVLPQFDATTRVKGHIDAALVNTTTRQVIIIDTKTKAWSRGWSGDSNRQEFRADSDFRDNYVVQVGTYGVGFDGAKHGALFEFNKAGSEFRTGWIDLQEVLPLVEQRFAEVIARSNPSNPEPEIGPLEWTKVKSGESWACGYLTMIGSAKSGKRGMQKISKGYCEYHECPNHIVSRVRALAETAKFPGDKILAGEVF